MTPAEYDDATGYEIQVLGSVVRLMPKARTGTGLDLDTLTANIVAADSIGGPEADWCRRLFAPLLFGAAWKVLDVTVEYVLGRAGVSRPSSSGNWPINKKVSAARLIAAPANFPLWAALVDLYGATTELRHSVVHRRVAVDSALTVTGFQADGRPLPSFGSISEAEQGAFCRFAQRVVAWVKAGAASARDESDARAQLAALGNFLGSGAFAPAPHAGGVLELQLTLPPTGELNLPEYLSIGKRTFPDAPWFDLVVKVPDGGVWICELETAVSQGVVKVDPINMPSWFQPS